MTSGGHAAIASACLDETQSHFVHKCVKRTSINVLRSLEYGSLAQVQSSWAAIMNAAWNKQDLADSVHAPPYTRRPCDSFIAVLCQLQQQQQLQQQSSQQGQVQS